jgi:hypothetical protein
MKKTILALALSLVFSGASAKEIEITGRGAVSISSGSPQSVKAMAFKEAKRNVVIAGINKINGPDSARSPKVAEKIQEIMDQISDDRFVNKKGQSVGDDYEMSLTLLMDDKEFKTLILDAGIAANATTTRSFAILAVMDEFFTTPTDLRAPLEELEEFSSAKGKSYKDKSISAKSNKQASANSSSSASAIDARASSSGKASGSYDSSLDARSRTSVAASGQNGYGGSANYAGSDSGSVSASDKGRFAAEQKQAASYKEANANSQSAASAKSDSAISANNVASEEHDNVHYKKLIKYQPQNRGPEKTSKTYNALMGQFNDYDLKVLDNDLFRSKYFKNKPITIEQMQNSAELSKYVAFAKTDAKADFFLVGSSIIIDTGKNAATGESNCTGVMTIKTYSVVSGENIASETSSETASGVNADDCAAAAAKKLAGVGGPIISSRVQEYWKRRNTYGREYVVTLTGQSLSLMSRMAFSKAVKSVPGVEGDVQRASSDKEYQLVVTYKGTDPLDQAVAMNLSANAVFASLDSRTDGNQITLCMGPCAKPAAETLSAKGKQK